MARTGTKPSEIKDRYWIFQVYEQYTFDKPKAERESGKWLIFDSVTKIDALWVEISAALVAGKLGPSAKVATGKPNPNARDNATRVICVFTEDYNDKEDVYRVEKALRELGIKNKLIYKLDRDVGKYAHNGYKNLIQEISEARS